MHVWKSYNLTPHLQVSSHGCPAGQPQLASPSGTQQPQIAGPSGGKAGASGQGGVGSTMGNLQIKSQKAAPMQVHVLKEHNYPSSLPLILILGIPWFNVMIAQNQQYPPPPPHTYTERSLLCIEKNCMGQSSQRVSL